MTQTSIEIAGMRYTITHFLGKTYSVRTESGELIGMFLLDAGEQDAVRVLGAEGLDVATTLLVAEAALDARLLPMRGDARMATSKRPSHERPKDPSTPRDQRDPSDAETEPPPPTDPFVTIQETPSSKKNPTKPPGKT